MTIRAYKIQVYPNAVQRVLLNQYFGIARWVWNFALSMMSKAYSRRKHRVSYVGASKVITKLKKTRRYWWLIDAPSDVISQKLRDLDRAYQNFFAGRAKYPRFKKRGRAEAIRFVFDNRHAGKIKAWVSGEMVLPKLGAMKTKQRLPIAAPKMITVRRDGAGRYFASFAVEEVIKPKPKTGQVVGIDMGLKSLATMSNGEVIKNPNHYRSDTKQLRRANKSLARKRKGSGRWKRAAAKLAGLHARIRDRRRDYLHKATTQIIESQDVICVESLHVKGMARNRRLALSIHDASMSEFLSMLKYKAEWYGKELIEIDQWYPSSKTCSCCGHVLDELDLSTRSWECPVCKTWHDRDFNASFNILAEGLRVRAGSPNLGMDSKKRVDLSGSGSRVSGSETDEGEARIVFQTEPTY